MNLLSFFINALAIIIAITVHEFAHAKTADHLGDPTPRLQGRLTLNPLAHLDPIGTLMLFLVRFGWGKPVQFDPFNLRNPGRDTALISLAGPGANVLVASIASLFLHLAPDQFAIVSRTNFITASGPAIFYVFLQTLIVINIVLAVFNMIPIAPLDGFKIVAGLLNKESAKEWYKLERYGMFFLLLLVLPLFGDPPISRFLSPVVSIILNVLLPNSGGFI